MVKISVITVCFNTVSTLEKTILSVLNQSYPNIEYIIIDGGSTDGSVDIIKKYADRLAYWVSEPDRGVYDAMNKGIIVATGDYTIFINSGDYFYSNDVLMHLSNERFEDADLIYGPVYVESKKGYSLWEADALFLKTKNKRRLVFGAQGICHQGLFTKTALLKKYMFDLNYSICADTDLTYKIFLNGNHVVKKLDFIVSVYDSSIDGISHNKSIEIIRQYKRIYSFNNDVLFYILLFFYCSKIYIKRIVNSWLH